MEENKGVEAINDKAPIVDTGVETIEHAAPVAQPEVDYAAQLLAKDEELAKLARERENYKQGMLRAKGKVSEEELFADEISQEDKLRSIVREELLSTESARIAQEREEILAKVLRENSELKLSNKAKTQMSSAPVSGGSNLERPKSDTEFWSADQLAAMKARGIDPDKAKENYLKLKKETY